MNKKVCIGILGGGQLARMSALEAYKLGFDVSILEKEFNSPAGQLTKNEFTGWVDNEEIFNSFAASSDVITLENEFIRYEKLEFLEKLGKPVFPSSKTISLIQDKYIQKSTLKRAGIPVPDFIDAHKQSYSFIESKLGKEFILKSRTMGYDGYGNAFVDSNNSFNKANQILSSRKSNLYAEKLINFIKELAVMVVRTKKEIVVYPVVETIQKHHICNTVIAPASAQLINIFPGRKISNIIKKVKEIAIESVKAVDGIGLFGIEFFLDETGEIMVNEMAPRPHNSGHYTIETCITSQFENHIRSVLGLPLGSSEMINKFAVMVNILGKKSGAGFISNYNNILKGSNIHFHLYGKEKSRKGRKMGHITVTGDDLQEVLSVAQKASEKVKI